MDYGDDTGSIERVEDLGDDPKAIVRRWLLELRLADKREKDWRKSGIEILSKYRQKKQKKNSYNILWANTETLAPAIYNSVPTPDVRRRFRDDDPVGKAVSEVLRRSLSYETDTGALNESIQAACLDMLLPGRGVVRVRYVPRFSEMEPEEAESGNTEESEGMAEELAWEQAAVEHVQWDDFRMSSGKEWGEVWWIGFRHRLTREELCEKFGDELGELVNLDAAEDDDIKAERDDKLAESFKTAEVWEIWDKDDKKVHFVSAGYKDGPLSSIDDPLQLVGFWPTPKPLYAIEDSGTMVPTPLYEMYREQAEELDRVSQRINTLIKGLKLRGVYDATLSELSELMRGDDNDLIPAQNVSALIDRGGLEKAIWFMPITQAALVIKELYIQRDQTKAVIYEITGISDILRGSTDAGETATAQQIKHQWGSNRLRHLQAKLANYVRDIIRIQAEIIAERFQPETLAAMSGMKFPTGQEKAMAIAQWQQQAAMAQMHGQQPPPKPNLPPSWDEIMAVLHDDAQRTFKVDVETDSTISASLETDMAALKEVLGGVTQLVQGLGPAVQMGAMPVGALKELILAVTRRAKLGNAVEDALEGISQPQTQQQNSDNSAQVEQMRQQGAQQLEQMKQQHEAAITQHKLQVDQAREQLVAQREAEQTQLQHQIEQMKAERESALEAQRLEYEDQWKRLDADVKLAVAQIQSKTQMDTQRATLNSQQGIVTGEDGAPMAGQTLAVFGEQLQSGLDATLATVNEQLQMILQAHSAPKIIERGPDGRAISINGRAITRDPSGRITAIN
jgi:hypothetical protein